MKTYDAGIERETLADELACWKAAGFIDGRRAERWHRRERRLAKACGMATKQMTADLEADAEVLLDEE